ncbi:MAG: hypothetical protein PHQ96_05095, partial [Candidatus Omnitrophica bacterium]|nr:hypothetical protein [Candidatus Omnitrophota bacterium]
YMKYFVNILAALVVLLIILSAISRTQNPKDAPFGKGWKKFTQWAGDFLKAKEHNLSMEVSPTRHRKISFIEQEERMRLFAPDLFANFNENDWQEFWELIYKPVDDKQGGFTVKRYRSQEEIQEILIQRYPNPFSYLSKEYWRIFWQDIIGTNFSAEAQSEQ